jgi:pimeloyl-ACP methyl ester carboxylesterase
MDRLRRTLRIRALALLAVLALMAGLVAGTVTGRAAETREDIGVIGGAVYKIRVPDPWNGTLLLYSHGYRRAGTPPPKTAADVGDPATGAYLLGQGYALAGSDYSRPTGWAVEQAFNDQIALLHYFDSKFGHPTRTIAWGHSLGGLITAGVVQRFPERFAAALPMCGVLAGSVAIWNVLLDAAFAFKTLIAPDSALELVNITNPTANLGLALQLLETAQTQRTPEGRARIALMAALADIPGWIEPGALEPPEDDYAAREMNQYLWAKGVDFSFAFRGRAELESRAGGNPSWNTGANYRKQLERSPSHEMVEALYETAGLSLEDDLARLEAAPRIAAKPTATNYLVRNIAFDGNLHGIPVLTLHTNGDGLVPVENEQAYDSVVRSAGNKKLLRQVYVHRAGHCTFTPAETITALSNLIGRLDSGKWGDLEPEVLNAAAAALGPLNTLGAGPVPPQFFEFEPAPYPRPFDSRALQGD